MRINNLISSSPLFPETIINIINETSAINIHYPSCDNETQVKGNEELENM